MNALSLATLALHALGAPPAAWEAALVPATVAEHFAGVRGGVVVVGAGAAHTDLAALSAALKQAIERSAKVEVVMDAQGLGVVAQLADAQIIERAAHLPVERIAIVRIMLGSQGTTGVVSLVTRDGKAAGGFSVRPGVPIAAPGAPATTVSDEATRLADAASPAIPEPPPPPLRKTRDLSGWKIALGAVGGLLGTAAGIMLAVVPSELEKDRSKSYTSTNLFIGSMVLFGLGAVCAIASVALPHTIYVSGPESGPHGPSVVLGFDVAPVRGGVVGALSGSF